MQLTFDIPADSAQVPNALASFIAQVARETSKPSERADMSFRPYAGGEHDLHKALVAKMVGGHNLHGIVDELLHLMDGDFDSLMGRSDESDVADCLRDFKGACDAAAEGLEDQYARWAAE